MLFDREWGGNTLFDFETFRKLVERCYEPGPYRLGMVIGVFQYYFACYEQRFGEPHPNIRMDQIRRIISAMPYVNRDDIGGYYPDIDYDTYPFIIDRHFRTNYRNCDYNINHFFSGKIRELRLHECERGE